MNADKPQRQPTPPKTANVASISKLTDKLSEKIGDFAKLSAEDRAKFLLETLTENMPSDETLQKMAAFTAKTRYIAYKAHIDAGFSEEQAMALCLNK